MEECNAFVRHVSYNCNAIIFTIILLYIYDILLYQIGYRRMGVIVVCVIVF